MTPTASASKWALTPSATRVVLAVVWLALGHARRLVRAIKHRRQAHMLLGLDDRMLTDIGLTRSDVHDAYAEPLWQDPTTLLRARALERRLSRHGISFGLPEPRDRAPSLAPEIGPLRDPSPDRAARYLI
jgi:uncharacterized protein YjiS (DUF1127 family)